MISFVWTGWAINKDENVNSFTVYITLCEKGLVNKYWGGGKGAGPEHMENNSWNNAAHLFLLEISFLMSNTPPPSQMGTKISCTSPLPLLLDTPSISFQSQWIVISYITSRFAHESACHMHVCPQQKFHTIVYQNVKTLHKWPPLIAVQCQDFYLPDRDYPLDNMIFSLNKN